MRRKGQITERRRLRLERRAVLLALSGGLHDVLVKILHFFHFCAVPLLSFTSKFFI
jgi:hypothetical protein